MAGFETTEHVINTSILHDATTPDLVLTANGLEVHAGRGSDTQIYTLTGDQLGWAASNNATSSYVTANIGGRVLFLEETHFDRLTLSAGESEIASADAFYASQSGLAADRVCLLAIESGGQTFYVAGAAGQSGLYTLTQNGAGILETQFHVNDTATTYVADPYVMASLEQGGRNFVFAASQSEAGVTAYELMANGQLQVRGNLGSEDGVGISLPSALVVAQIAGKSMLLLGSAGTGTITVMDIGVDGNLTLLDQATDDLTTRFAGITVMDSLTVNNRVYVVAAGSDDGLSLFILLPDGQLMHLESLEDQLDIGLNNVNGLALSETNGVLHVFVTSETEAGVTHLTVDAGDAGQVIYGGDGADVIVGGNGDDMLVGGDGNDQITAGAGNDILLDGTGQDVLTGGAGEDTFVLTADYNLDEIFEFRLGEDHITVSSWDRLYSVAQLTITSLADGALITYGAERIELHMANGESLVYADFIDNDVFGLYRPTITNPGPVVYIGTPESDVFNAGAGDDSLSGNAGHDVLDGGAGDDTLHGGTGADQLYGNTDHDRLYGDSSTDQLFGGDGDDYLAGGTGADVLHGGDGDDYLYGNTGVDIVYGDAGADYISTGNGADIGYGGAGDDYLIGRTGWDTLYGGGGNDELLGSQGVDTLYGENGRDTLGGGSGEDFLYGGKNDDILYGNFGNDFLDGGDGQDALFGGTGDDELYGGDGADTIQGNQGLDLINGGSGNDDLRGGTLADTFVFDIGHDQDSISDFENSQDFLSLSLALTGGLTEASTIISQFGGVVGGVVVFDFGSGDSITLSNLSSLSGLEDNILVF